MKRNFRNIALSAVALLAISCTIDYVQPDQSKLPQASSLTPVITVDQETNYVTFSVEETGLVPLWIFGDEKIDGKANKKYAYAQDGITLRFRDAGTHTVELKAYNANGISQGSQMVSFTLENTYRDPFDASPYMKAIANTWVWNSSVAGHFGCGETAANPTGWWSCDANGKADWSLYDDKMTFTAEGDYTYDPGDGLVYVNKDSGFGTNPGTGEDYTTAIDTYTHKYSIENNWNDAGIEEIFLVLQEGDNLSYIPNKETLTNPRYQFLETSTSKIKKTLSLSWYTPTGNNGGPIAWKYEFIPYVKGVTVEDLLAGTDAAGKVWIMDADATGHLACGESLENPANWWAAKSHEKDGFGMYDNELTFAPDGSYTFNPGPDGLIYANKDVTALGGPASEDFTVAWEVQNGKYTFDGEKITLPAGMTVGYVPNDNIYNEPVFHVTTITETKLVLVASIDGISWQFIFKARDVKEPESSFGGVAFEGGKANISLVNGNEYTVTGIDLSKMWIDPDFFEKTGDNTLKFIAYDGEYQIMNKDTWLKAVPMAGSEYATYDDGAIWIIGTGIQKPKGTAEPGWTTDAGVDIPFARTGEHSYKLTAYVTGPNFKLFGQPAWGKEFGGNDYGTVETNNYFTINGYPGGADSDNGNIWSGSDFVEGWYVFTVVDNGGVLDMTVDRWKTETVVYDITGDGNLWKGATINPEYWYSAADWSGQIKAEAEIGANNSFTAYIPDGVGGSEWQAQNKLHSGISTSSDKKYDFCCTIKADADMVITIKLTGNPEGDGDPHAFFYNGNVAIEKGEALTFQMSNISQRESNDDMTVIFDFGRSANGSTIEVTDICFQEHNATYTIVE